MNVIRQTARFNAPASHLFDIYIDPKRHAAATGAPVKISRRTGSRFSAFGGVLTGRTLLVVPKQLIVQSWRSRVFRKTDPDSLLILTFADTRKGSRIDLVHIGVPDHDVHGVQRGWPKHYWRPLRAYLNRRRAAD